MEPSNPSGSNPASPPIYAPTKTEATGVFNHDRFDGAVLDLCVNSTCFGPAATCEAVRIDLQRKSFRPGVSDSARTAYKRLLERYKACLAHESSLVENTKTGLFRLSNELVRDAGTKGPGAAITFALSQFMETKLGKEMGFHPIGVFYARTKYPGHAFVAMRLGTWSSICVVFTVKLDTHARATPLFISLMNSGIEKLLFVSSRYFKDSGSRAVLVRVYENEDTPTQLLEGEPDDNDGDSDVAGVASSAAADARGRAKKRARSAKTAAAAAAAASRKQVGSGEMGEDPFASHNSASARMDQLGEICSELSGCLISYQFLPVYYIPSGCFSPACDAIEIVPEYNM